MRLHTCAHSQSSDIKAFLTQVLVIRPHLDPNPLKVLIADSHLVSCRYSERTTSRPSEAFSHPGRTSSSPSEETGGGRKPSANRGKRRRRNPAWDESQYETEYTTGGETGNELDGDEWER